MIVMLFLGYFLLFTRLIPHSKQFSPLVSFLANKSGLIGSPARRKFYALGNSSQNKRQSGYASGWTGQVNKHNIRETSSSVRVDWPPLVQAVGRGIEANHATCCGRGGVECAQLWTDQLSGAWGPCILLYGVSAGVCPPSWWWRGYL